MDGGKGEAELGGVGLRCHCLFKCQLRIVRIICDCSCVSFVDEVRWTYVLGKNPQLPDLSMMCAFFEGSASLSGVRKASAGTAQLACAR